MTSEQTPTPDVDSLIVAGHDMHDLLVELGRTAALPAGMHERVIRVTETWWFHVGKARTAPVSSGATTTQEDRTDG